uniref:Uncharacterized protein n=2 Tax=Brassica oleracea TaxID=3712 RepID=A0A0D3E9Y9_BRAOL|nr:unnamed protein product [Brassica oleracea]
MKSIRAQQKQHRSTPTGYHRTTTTNQHRSTPPLLHRLILDAYQSRRSSMCVEIFFDEETTTRSDKSGGKNRRNWKKKKRTKGDDRQRRRVYGGGFHTRMIKLQRISKVKLNDYNKALRGRQPTIRSKKNSNDGAVAAPERHYSNKIERHCSKKIERHCSKNIDRHCSRKSGSYCSCDTSRATVAVKLAGATVKGKETRKTSYASASPDT